MIIHNTLIQAVVSDFDGTIIKEGMINPPPLFFEAAEKLLAQGIPFIAASGRQYANLRRILSPLADRISYIAENGCLVVCDNQILYKSAIKRELAKELFEDMNTQKDAEIMISGEDTSYLISKNQAFIDMLRYKVKNNITLFQDFDEITEDILKMSVYWNTGIPALPEQAFHEKYDSLLQVANGGNGWLDFNSPDSGKGPALKLLAKHMGIDTAHMIAFGDNENDITMLKEAGISYAVASARPHVKSVADYVCDSVEKVLLDSLPD